MKKNVKKLSFLKKTGAALLAVAVATTSLYVYDKKTNQSTVEAASGSRQVEYLDRGLIAMKTTDGVYVGWRYLGTDPTNIGFNVYRDGKKINSSVITDSTNFLDKSGSTSSSYYIRTVVNDKESEQSDAVSVWGNQYKDVKLQKPASGKTKSGKTYTYSPNDCSVADLDGDGEYEIIVKWDPSNSKDNSQKGYTGNVYLDAYKLDGTMLWRIDLGVNIRAGAHYTQFMVYDFDGDGYAEMVCKTADGTKDGKGKYIGDKSKDYRNSNGYILSGPEYLTLFDGKTGAALDTIDYEPGRGNVSSWGDRYGNRVDRFLATVAYLDGKTPSVVMCRGYYTRSVLVAYDVKNKKLSKRWTFDSNSSGNSAYKGQGFHNLATADVDGDGYDEIVYGACTIDHNGKGLYSTGLKHGDAIHVGDFDPTRDGLEVWGCFEKTYGSAEWDAKTGKILFRVNASTDTGRCIAGNFIPGNSTAEMASYADSVLYDAKGNKVGKWSDITKWGMNYAIYWDADLEQEALDRTFVDDYTNGRILTGEGVTYNNSTKSNTCLTADILGDWREEIIWPTTDGNALRIYSTTDVTSYRIYTLMHNTQYRCQVAAQNVAYNQGAYTDYYLGTGYALPSQPNVYTAGSHTTNTVPDSGSSSDSSSSVTAASLSDGWYYIKNVNAQKYLQVAGGKGADGANVEISTGTGATGQKWYLENKGNGYVTLKNATGYMLDLTNGKKDNGTNIGLWSANNLDPQLFKIAKSSTNDQYGILTKVTGDSKGLDCAGYGKTDGTNVQQYSYGAQSNQLWIFEKTSYSESSSGNNSSNSGSSSSDNNSSNSGNSGSDSSNSSSSVTAASLSDGWYYIKNVNAQKYLQVAGGTTGSDGANVEISKGTGATGQRWYLENKGDGYVTLKNGTGYMLDLTNGKKDNGTNIGLWSANNLDPQLFKIATSKTNNQYGILTKVTGDSKGLDCAGYGKTDGTNVQQYSYGAQSNQLWIFETCDAPSSGSSNNSNNSNSSSSSSSNSASASETVVTMNGSTLDLSPVAGKTITAITFDLTSKSTGNGSAHLKGTDGSWLGSADYSYTNEKTVTIDLSKYNNIGNIDLYMWWNSNNASITNIRVKTK